MDYGFSATHKVFPSPHMRGDDTPDLCGIGDVSQYLVTFRISARRMQFQPPRHLCLLPIFLLHLDWSLKYSFRYRTVTNNMSNAGLKIVLHASWALVSADRIHCGLQYRVVLFDHFQ